MNGLPWIHKAWIGACGGLCLVLLKLIDAGFYVDNFSSKLAIVGYLTYFAYLIIGTIVSVILSDHDGPREKIIKSAFIAGLLGPSILIAILKQPVVPNHSSNDVLNIPRISDLFISPAHAQMQDEPTKYSGEALPFTSVQILGKETIEPSFKDAFLETIGRPVATKNHVYVIGVADNEGKATATAENVNKLISKREGSLTAQVMKLEGKHKYYVTIGGLKKSSEAMQVKGTAQATAIETLKGNPDKASEKAAIFILQGKVVTAEALFK